jgi:outer membrane lipase/esterase
MSIRYLRICALLLGVAGGSASAHAQPYSDLFVFGDSLTDSGNAFFITTHAGPLIPEIPAPPYFEGRFSNGLNFADDLNVRLFGQPASAAATGGNNYAVGGSTTGTANVAAPGDTGMRVQADTYLKTRALGGADPNALYLVYGGSNDVLAAVDEVAHGGDPATVTKNTVDTAMVNLGEILSELSGGGAQHFLIPNLADIGTLPRFLGNTALSSFASQASTQFNTALAALLKTYPTLDIRELDVHAAFDAARAGLGGFADTTTACYGGTIRGGPPDPCATPDTHLFWDDIHPSARTHAVLGELAYAAAVPEPGEWLILLVGVLLTCIGVRRTRAR